MWQPIRLNRTGFSLLELLVVVAVILVLLTFTMPQIGRYWQVYQLDSATQTLTSNLEFARYTAISRCSLVTVSFHATARYYDFFEDANGNGTREPSEKLMGTFSLPAQVSFSGAGLLGPPGNPTGPVSNPITFNDDRIVFNSRGKIQNGMGCIYLKTDFNDATSISFNIAGRMKIYSWNQIAHTWK
ncbi:MAG TPA: GspH/FimT family protein [Terriglobia bacterium]|nr:GspH/FimT family protein [Terriglobia bacterium]